MKSRRWNEGAKSAPQRGESMRMEDVFVTPVSVKINDRHGEITVGAKGDEPVTSAIHEVIRHHENIDAFRPIGVTVLGPPTHNYLAMAAMHMHMSKQENPPYNRVVGFHDPDEDRKKHQEPRSFYFVLAPEGA